MSVQQKEYRSSERTTSHPPPSLPAGWRVDFRGTSRARYGYGSHLYVEIEPRGRVSRSRRSFEPTSFRVLLQKRFYGRVPGDVTVLGTVDSFDDAAELSRAYMVEFVDDRKDVAMETREGLEADPVMAPHAEEAIITEAATEATIEVAGYSDDLLVNELCGLIESTNEVDGVMLQAIVHRQETAYDVVYVAVDRAEWNEANRLEQFHKQFDWLNEQRLAATLGVGELTIMTATFEETRMLRYLASEDEETIILIHPDLPIHLPPFERQIADIVSAKWEPSAG